MKPTSQQNPPAAAARVQTSTVLRDAVVLQGKLVIDGLRDALLIPVAFVAAIISLLAGGEEKGRLFYDVVRLGKRSERWINLFGAVENNAPEAAVPESAMSLDDYLAEVEGRLRAEYRDGGTGSQARQALGALVDSFHAAREKFGGRREPTESHGENDKP